MDDENANEGTNTYLSPLEVRIQIGVGTLDVSVLITLLFCESVRFPAWRTASRKGILERGWRGLKKYDNWGYKITMNHYSLDFKQGETAPPHLWSRGFLTKRFAGDTSVLIKRRLSWR